MTALMKCGHSAQGRKGNGRPVCVICYGLDPGADQVADSPDLSSRDARCYYCKRVTKSNVELPFFTYQPEDPLDDYYCGCHGWN